MSANSDSIPKGNGNVLNLLRNHGWGTGFHNPFSNEENKTLEEKLEQIQRKRQSVCRDLDTTNEHVNDLRRYEVNLHIDIKLRQEMSTAKTAHLDHERVIHSQSEKEYAFITREHRRLCQMAQDLKERNRKRLVEFEKRQKELNDSIAIVEQDKNLAQFLQNKEITMMDEMNEIDKFKTLDKDEVKRVYKDLDDLEKINRNMTASLESHLRKTTEASDHYRRLCLEFRHAHRKRKEMLQLWTATLTALRSRDDDLQEMAAEYYEAKERIKTEMETHDCLTSFFEQRGKELEDVEYRYSFYESELRNCNEALDKLKHHLLTLKTEHVHVVSTTQKLTLKNQNVRQRIGQTQEEMETSLEKEENIKAELLALQKSRAHVQSISSDQDKLFKELDRMIKTEEEWDNRLDYHGVQIRKHHFEKTNEKVSLQEELIRVNMRMKLIDRIFSRIHAREYENTSMMAARQSRLYRADLEVSTLEMKISRVINATVEPRFFKLQIRRERLRAKNINIISTNAFVGREGERVGATLQALVDDIDTHRVNTKHMDSSVNEARLTLAETERQAEGVKEDLKQLKLKYNLMKISARRLKSSVLAYGGKIFTLSQMRNLFQAAGNERKSEIEFHLTLIRKKSSLLRREISFIENSAYRTSGYIKKLKGKFELLSGTSLTKEDASNKLFKEMTAVFRQRTKLKNEKFNWETQIEQDMKEVEGLRNVLAILKGSNDAYKQSLMPATQSGGDSRLIELETLEKRVSVYRNRCKRHIEKLEKQAQVLSKEIGTAKAGMRKATAQADEKFLDISTNKNESKYLEERIGRWDQLISRISTNEGTWKEQGLQYFIELELNQKMMEEKYEHAMRKMLGLIKQDPQIRKTIYLFLREHNMMDQFMERMHISERLLFEQYCETSGETDIHGICGRATAADEEESPGEEVPQIKRRRIPSGEMLPEDGSDDESSENDPSENTSWLSLTCV